MIFSNAHSHASASSRPRVCTSAPSSSPRVKYWIASSTCWAVYGSERRSGDEARIGDCVFKDFLGWRVGCHVLTGDAESIERVEVMLPALEGCLLSHGCGWLQLELGGAVVVVP